MRHCFILYLFAAIVSISLSCQKETPFTIIRGIVTNKTTGEPVEGAYLACSYIMENGRPKDISTYSDAQGKYSLEIPQTNSFSFSAVYHLGKYLTLVGPTRSVEIRTGETNQVNVALIPTDGFLRVKFQNDIPQNDSLYLYFFNPINESQFAIGGWVSPKELPFVLPDVGSYQKVFEFPSEVYTSFYWGFHAFTPQLNASLRDSVFLPRNDTVDFTIHF
jgi:hypothetical protein